MKKEVDLVSYLPPFLKEYRELREALEAENPEFSLVWSAAERVYKNRFISTADEYGLSRFENLLKIHPSIEDTLEDRRTRIRLKWYNKVFFTERMLREMLDNILGQDRYTLEILYDKKTVEVRINDPSRAIMLSIAELLEEVIPLDQLIRLILQKETYIQTYIAVKTMASLRVNLHDNGQEVINHGKSKIHPYTAVKSFAGLKINVYSGKEGVDGA